MGRAMQMAFFILCFSFSMSLLNEINACYMYGNLLTTCPDESGTGRMFIPYSVQPLVGYTLVDADGNSIDPNNVNSYNNTMQSIVAYKTQPTGISDLYGFFSWVVTAGRLLINTLFMPLFGFPGLLEQFWIPAFMTYPIGALIMLIQIIGLYELYSGREII